MMKHIKKNAVVAIIIAYVMAMGVLLLVIGKHTHYNGNDPEYNRLSGYKTVAATDTVLR